MTVWFCTLSHSKKKSDFRKPDDDSPFSCLKESLLCPKTFNKYGESFEHFSYWLISALRPKGHVTVGSELLVFAEPGTKASPSPPLPVVQSQDQSEANMGVEGNPKKPWQLTLAPTVLLPPAHNLLENQFVSTTLHPHLDNRDQPQALGCQYKSQVNNNLQLSHLCSLKAKMGSLILAFSKQLF